MGMPALPESGSLSRSCPPRRAAPAGDHRRARGSLPQGRQEVSWRQCRQAPRLAGLLGRRRSNSPWPAAIRCRATALCSFRSASVCADPMCSMSREPRRCECTICTALAPEAVSTVRTYATAGTKEPARLVRAHHANTPGQRPADPEISQPWPKSGPMAGRMRSIPTSTATSRTIDAIDKCPARMAAVPGSAIPTARSRRRLLQSATP